MTAAEAFRILGVPPTADAAKIKQVYHALAMAWHADTSGLGNDDRMKELNAAYACLQQAGPA